MAIRGIASEDILFLTKWSLSFCSHIFKEARYVFDGLLISWTLVIISFFGWTLFYIPIVVHLCQNCCHMSTQEKNIYKWKMWYFDWEKGSKKFYIFFNNSYIREAPSWNVLVLYGHCTNSLLCINLRYFSLLSCPRHFYLGLFSTIYINLM